MKLIDLGGEPNPKQKQFLTAKKRYVAYGGARGGGKSWSVRRKAALLALNDKYAGIKILIIRRTYAELRANHINILKQMIHEPIARYNEANKEMRFYNGSMIAFGYCDSASDIDRYQGTEWDVIFLDEATQFSEEVFNALRVCIRGANGFPKRMYLTCNPGGVGHEWVKRLFITKEYKPTEDANDYLFIPATVYDNKALLEQDRTYVQVLESLPEKKRAAWLEGDWDSYEGQYFTEFDKGIHVCKAFNVPDNWRKYAAIDYGLDMLAVVFVAIDFDGRAWVYKEIHEPNRIISDAASIILKNKNDIFCIYAPPDLWGRSQETGKSRADIFAENGVYLTKCKSDRLAGWSAVHEWLTPMKNEIGQEVGQLMIMDHCTNLIRCLPAVQHDEKNTDDVATEPHELTHIVDALRYFCVSYTDRPVIEDNRKYYEKDDWEYTEEDNLEEFLNWKG